MFFAKINGILKIPKCMDIAVDPFFLNVSNKIFFSTFGLIVKSIWSTPRLIKFFKLETPILVLEC